MYYLALYLQTWFSPLNVVHYVTMRMMASLITSLLLCIFFGSLYIRWAKRFCRSKARELTPENHRAKDDTPTMGGLMILGVAILSSLAWCNWYSCDVWILITTLVLFGAIGLWDDCSKIWYKKGITETSKFYAQCFSALLVGCGWLWLRNPTRELCIPFFKNFQPDLGLFLIPWIIFILVGSSNAVNLTDGLDGLAAGSLLLNVATFGGLAYAAGHFEIAHYLSIPFAGTSEIAIVATSLIGSLLGFLWYNAYPAELFMGDVGSLSLGAGLAMMAIMTRQELLLPVAGGLFVAETVSVMLQVWYYRRYKVRFFKMAPLHHHFELLGWHEAKVTTRFIIITLILCLISVMTLKLR
jgi:phospho-N-acetylmuramoyl-pentapeptide-transferase